MRNCGPAAMRAAKALADPEVVDWLHPPADTNPFELAIRRAIPTRSNAAMSNLFLNRVTLAGMRSWRVGRRLPPHWARELLKEKLRQQVAELQGLIERL